jgi:exodeoxyribonuclease V alpha subunit
MSLPAPKKVEATPEAKLLATTLLAAFGPGASNDQALLALATAAYEAALKGSTCAPVGQIDTAALIASHGTLIEQAPTKPSKALIVRPSETGQMVYLGRLDELEGKVREQLAERNGALFDPMLKPENIWLPADVPEKQQTCVDQRSAVTKAVQTSFVVLCGGPGTGKTTTAACMIGAAISNGLDLKDIRICAPTGRAASRLRLGLAEEGKPLSNNLKAMSCANREEFLGKLPKAYTIHKLVHNPVEMAGAKLVVVDECSMIDLFLFHRLLSLVPADARLILIGDPQQLPSVDTGSVFDDVCRSEALEKRKVTLRQKFRATKQASEWTQYAEAIMAGDEDVKAPGDFLATTNEALLEACLKGFETMRDLAVSSDFETLGLTDPKVKANILEQRAGLLKQTISTRVLCARRGGKHGVNKINELVRKKLVLKDDDQPGSLIMITRNDHKVTDLSNGDVGIVVKGGRVWFPGKTVSIDFNQLPPHAPAFATTIHKAQGSEYDHVILVIPKKEADSEESDDFISQQLVFTGITRAVSKLTVFGDEDLIVNALKKPALKASGLQARLDSNL